MKLGGMEWYLNFSKSVNYPLQYSLASLSKKFEAFKEIIPKELVAYPKALSHQLNMRERGH
jgi:hypothetical protein